MSRGTVVSTSKYDRTDEKPEQPKSTNGVEYRLSISLSTSVRTRLYQVCCVRARLIRQGRQKAWASCGSRGATVSYIFYVTQGAIQRVRAFYCVILVLKSSNERYPTTFIVVNRLSAVSNQTRCCYQQATWNATATTRVVVGPHDMQSAHNIISWRRFTGVAHSSHIACTHWHVLSIYHKRTINCALQT